MEKLIYSVFFIACSCLVNAQAILPVADFESYETTPYFFRYGNKGNQDMSTYKPRWVYSHEIVENPYLNGNTSSKVIKYTSMEARDYGLKFRFVVPPTVDELKSVSFLIYQPENVIGKPIDTQYNSGQQMATSQKIVVKLLTNYNSVCDFRSEDGIILTAQEFTKENGWVAFKFTFDKSSYNSTTLNKFKNGIAGIAILPTYGSNVTLAESNVHVCFIDNIDINESLLGITSDMEESDNFYYENGYLFIPEVETPTKIYIYNLSGVLVEESVCEEKTHSVPLDLPESRPFIVKIQQVDGKTYQRIIFRK